MKNHSTSNQQLAGFSLVEVLASVLIIGGLSSIAIIAVTAQEQKIARVKMDHQVTSLNAAVQSYELAGGVLDTAETTDDVLAKLKSFAKSDQKAQILGLSESFIDPRLTAVPLTSEETATSMPRVVWNPTMRRFLTTNSGANGTREFVYGTEGVIIEDPDARKLAVKMAMQDNWVWDYTDRDADSHLPEDEGGSSDEIADVPVGGPPALPQIELDVPEFSVASGNFQFDEFGISLELTNPNPSLISAVYYSVNDGQWKQYAGPIMVTPEDTIEAFSMSLDPLSYTDSIVRTEVYNMIGGAFSGVATGNFLNPVGAENMVVTSAKVGNVATFEWGTPVSTEAPTDSPSVLSFIGHGFGGAAPGELFSLGTLDYLNGTIQSGTEAWEVDLAVDIDFSVPDVQEQFVFSLALENTPNQGVDPDADADFVRMLNVESNFSTMLNGITYALELQFGYEGPNGFSTVDQFHVHEGATARADIFGTFHAVHEDEEEEEETTPPDPGEEEFPPETTTPGDASGPGTADETDDD